MKKLVIFGTSSFAQIAYEYFTYDSDYEVGAFSAERKYMRLREMLKLSIIPFEEMEKWFNPEKNEMFLAIGYGQLNRLKERIFRQAKEKGYSLVTYVSSKSFIWRNAIIGENCFVFEDNVIQPFVRIGDNNTFWSGNHIGHHSMIGNHNFFSSHVVLSGNCQVGDRCFFGVNSTIANGLKIANDCVIGASSNIIKDLEPGGVYIGNPAKRIGETNEMAEIG